MQNILLNNNNHIFIRRVPLNQDVERKIFFLMKAIFLEL